MIIQIGPTLRSFKELPVTIGTGTKCELVLPFPGIQEAHAQIFFAQGQYWVKDLTGLGVVKVGGQPVGTQVPLNLQDELSLGPRGPVFRFMGEGRFAEVAVSPSPAPPPLSDPLPGRARAHPHPKGKTERKSRCSRSSSADPVHFGDSIFPFRRRAFSMSLRAFGCAGSSESAFPPTPDRPIQILRQEMAHARRVMGIRLPKFPLGPSFRSAAFRRSFASLVRVGISGGPSPPFSTAPYRHPGGAIRSRSITGDLSKGD